MQVQIPDKFKINRKSFVTKITQANSRSAISNFCAFPKNVSFTGKEIDECVVLLVRRSLVSYWPQYLLIFFFIIAPMIFGVLLSAWDNENTAAIGLAATILFWLLAFTTAVDTFLKWFYSVNIITDQRVIDVDFNNVLYHRYSEAQLENIQDVTHSVAGLLGSIFDYGDVYIQTAGTNPEFVFEMVPKPRIVQDTLQDLLEMKQEGTL
ncbi:MAG: hypothetical protein QY318_02570 [Candidatus Dojkabacteria bacterium]|nr:MAG: hypothetical protein QY318_02570 [Candidatus Dojkabacteria bacterium]